MTTSDIHVLIVHADLKDPGGVAGYFNKLNHRFTLPVHHFIVGKRVGEKQNSLSTAFRLMVDYCRLFRLLKTSQFDVVHVNPSLDFKSFFRDGIIVLMAKFFRIKTLVFFHGWLKSFETALERVALWTFYLSYGKADGFIVLSDEIRAVLRRWGMTQPIWQEVMVIDDGVIRNFDLMDSLSLRNKSGRWRILFISRILKEKGIYETINAAKILQAKYPDIELIITGDGPELQQARDYVKNHSIPNILFTGYQKGASKEFILRHSHVLCFPSYTEGMPNVVVESMAFGLPIITRPVGGLADLIKNGENGFSTTSKDPTVFALLLEKLYKDKSLYEKISTHNYIYAKRHFLSSVAVMRLENIYQQAANYP